MILAMCQQHPRRIQRQRHTQRQIQRQRQRQSAQKTHHMLYFRKAGSSRISDTTPIMTKTMTKKKTSIWVCLYCAEKFSAQSNINILDGLKSQQSRLMYKNVFRLKKIWKFKREVLCLWGQNLCGKNVLSFFLGQWNLCGKIFHTLKYQYSWWFDKLIIKINVSKYV